ncbi:DUF2271 domain-containing protein [bacterium SCSIO 12741]|nr:DUF2271 domain-containing protein [bacterium SCSIO 12741]
MKKTLKIVLFFAMITTVFAFSTLDGKKVKCMIQMENYEGEGAYVIISLINPEGKYDETLYVQGDDDEWYYEISSWWKFYGRNRIPLDGITGSTISGGERAITVFEVDESKIDKGYRIRFESAVEAKNYHEKDVEFELTTSNLQKKFNGKGFIRYIRLLPQ